MSKLAFLAKWGVAALLMTSLTSCEDILEQYFPHKPNPTTPSFPPLGQEISFYALSGGSRLDAYSTKDAATRISSVAISGLGSGEKLLAIDFRPATGQLYGVSSASRLYVINQNTGVARAIGAGAFTPALGGNLVGFDFNPTVDRIRLVTSTGQNLRLNPETGTVAATDGSIKDDTGVTLTGAAYTNNRNGVSTTALYAINTQNQQLYLVNPPNDGTVVPVGSLNLPVSGNGGFDIDATTGTALGLYSVNGQSTLFTVDLTTGAARALARYPASLNYSGLAIPTRLVAYALDTQRHIKEPIQYNGLYTIDPMVSSGYFRREIGGLTDREEVVGLDFRPATSQLYLLTSANRLYTLNPATAEATLVATLSIPLEGGIYGFDFNPVADHIRIVSVSGQNLRVNPVDGVAIADGRISPSGSRITGAAYNNNFAGATTTSLYVTHRSTAPQFSYTGTLYLQNPPNEGTLVKIAPLSSGIMHLDIGGTTNVAYAYGDESDGSYATSKIYTLNLTTGALTPLRTITDPVLHGFTVGLGF
ncbi:DUF4394 domain-containing protein [Hymenobacter sp. BT188]|uniref:DUF4394 domain-containing protein n=1 Tax=Hymenobacter sp. BT188 TaxID=2763504 RepID=UPI001651352C|nr:DUF4394 domain-containing protein [Hymenobacter sp. BT188]MBC6607962.1 DUF4394 domain-containing protein [Hymenobacter sp. BT188]